MKINLSFEIDTTTETSAGVKNLFAGFADVLGDAVLYQKLSTTPKPAEAKATGELYHFPSGQATQVSEVTLPIETAVAPVEIKPAPAPTETKVTPKRAPKPIVKAEDTSSIIPERDIVIEAPAVEEKPAVTEDATVTVGSLSDEDVERLTALRTELKSEIQAWAQANGAVPDAVKLLAPFGAASFSTVALERIEEFKATFENLKSTFVKP